MGSGGITGMYWMDCVCYCDGMYSASLYSLCIIFGHVFLFWDCRERYCMHGEFCGIGSQFAILPSYLIQAIHHSKSLAPLVFVVWLVSAAYRRGDRTMQSIGVKDYTTLRQSCFSHFCYTVLGAKISHRQDALESHHCQCLLWLLWLL